MREGHVQDSDLPDLWNELPAQLAAIVAVIGTTLGALRANGVLSKEDTSDIFTLADRLLPEHAGTHGASTLAAIKAIADRIAMK
jgi:hypothetical protein